LKFGGARSIPRRDIGGVITEDKGSTKNGNPKRTSHRDPELRAEGVVLAEGTP
jgi:hypothetical protein